MDILLILAMFAIFFVPIWLVYKLIKKISIETLLKLKLAIRIGGYIAIVVFLLFVLPLLAGQA